MFLLSFRLTKKKIAISVVAVAAAVGLGALGVRFLTGEGSAVPAARDSETVAARIQPRKVKAKSNEERVAFAEAFGWELDPAPLEVMEVIIPEEFDEVYIEYNDIQIKQGFDLEKQAGKRAKRYTYAILNYPGVSDGVRFNLLAIGDKIIGGDVSSQHAGGFMHGFEMGE
jgi:hypothetical protein